MKLFAIKDVKVGFNQPVIYPNEQAAIRMFNGYIQFLQSNSEQIDISADLELWYLGTLDQESGIIVSEPKFLSSGVGK